MSEIPNIRITSTAGDVLWNGYNSISEMDEITKAIFAKYGSITISLQSMPYVPFDTSIRHHFINDVEVTPREAETVWECLRPQENELVKRDFVDLDKVEAILKRCKLNDAI